LARSFIVLGIVGIFILFGVATFSTAFAATSTLAAPTAGKTMYTGYEVIGPYSTLRVEGSWVVPTANCATTPNSASNISVIIDGIDGEGDAMEIGTYQNCVHGVAEYGAFVNVYPNTGYFGENHGNISKVVVHPGDVIEAQGTWRPAGQKPVNWNTNFEDKTTGGVAIDTDAHTPTGFTPVLDSGALILSSDGHTLTSLSTISTGRHYTSVHDSDITGGQHATSTFGETAAMSGYTLVTWEIPGTSITALGTSGSSFQITG
jgi:Peptidase A4 family